MNWLKTRKENIFETSTTETGRRYDNPWISDETAIKEIQEKKQLVDYTEIFQGKQVIFLGDKHGNTQIRRHLYNNAEMLKKEGVTHFAIEAFSGNKAVFEQLNDQTDLSHVDVGPELAFKNTSDPYAGRAGAECVVKAMASQGIKVVPIDLLDSTSPDRNFTPKEREAHLAQKLRALLESNPESKVAVLIGSYHASKGMYPTQFMMGPDVEYGFPSCAQRMIDAHYSISTVQYISGNRQEIAGITSESELNHHEFMLHTRPYHELEKFPFVRVKPDYIIHLPDRKIVKRD